MKKYTREEVRSRLQARLDLKEPIIAVEAGVGLTAKMTEMYGVDLILITTMAMFRARGVDDSNALKPYGIANEDTYDQIRRMNRIIKEVPTVAGIAGLDPRLVIDEQLALFDRAHVSGVVNSPSVGIYFPFARTQGGKMLRYGLDTEIDVIQYSQDNGMFSIYDAYFEEDAIEFAKHKPDMIIINMNYSVEEGVDQEVYHDHERFPEHYMKVFDPSWLHNVDACCEAMEELYQKIKAISPGTFILVCGGPFNNIENIQKLFATTDLDGFLGGKFLEEDVIWKSITENQKAFATIDL